MNLAIHLKINAINWLYSILESEWMILFCQHYAKLGKRGKKYKGGTGRQIHIQSMYNNKEALVTIVQQRKKLKQKLGKLKHTA